MRFRLGTGGGGFGRGAMGGVDQGMQALFSAPMLQAQAAGLAQKDQTASDLSAAHQRQADATALLYGQKAEGERQQLARGGVGELAMTAAMMNKLGPAQAQEFSQYATTGQLPGQYVQPAEDLGGGPALPAPAYSDMNGLGGQIMQQLGLLRGGLTVGGKIDDVTKAGGELQDQGLVRDAVAAGQRGDDMAMSRLNTIRGKKEFTPFKAVGNTGTALNEVSGAQPVTNDAMNILFGKEGAALVSQRNAAAGASSASAEHSRASTGKVRAETDQIVNGPKGVLVQTEGGPVFSDPRSGNSVSVRNPDGTPATVAPKPLPEAAQKQVIGARNLQDGIAEYLTQLKTWSKTDMLSPDARAKMGTAYNNVMLQAKEAYNLGVLNGPDYDILQSVAADPTKPGALTKSNEALVGQARDLDRIAKGIESQVLKAHGRQVPTSAAAPAGPAGPPLKLSAKPDEANVQFNRLPSGAEFIAPDGSRRRKP